MPQVSIEIPETLYARIALIARESSRTNEEVLENWLQVPLSLYENDASKSLEFLERDGEQWMLKGTRIQLEHVLERHLLKGQSAEHIAQEFALGVTQIAAAIAYFHANPVECMALLASFLAWREDFEKQLQRNKLPGLKSRLTDAVKKTTNCL